MNELILITISLERELGLESKYAALTKGDSILIRYLNKEYYLNVLEIQRSGEPLDAITIIESDISVDFAPAIGINFCFVCVSHVYICFCWMMIIAHRAQVITRNLVNETSWQECEVGDQRTKRETQS